ncbi:MAG TPA: hypothetical protein VNA57_06465 [Acidimicrobiales bacterium]|nr:hypothetical protein [Acidimicrobiales bacterium]
MLGQSLKTLTVAKARTQGNEVATHAIEELQRLSYTALGVCTTAPNPPAEFVTVAKPVNCPSPVPANYGDDPCNTTVPVGIPKATFNCVRNAITYNVRRYVAWADAAQTSKRMAVFVGWRDPVGYHEVSQQSSLRAPGQSDIYGLAPPVITSVSVPSGTTVVRDDGFLPAGSNGLMLTAVTSNLTSADKVYVSFTTLNSSGDPITSSKNLAQTTANNWMVIIDTNDAFRFPNGTQYFSFGAIRTSDGKANSMFAETANMFCGQSNTTCSGHTYPQFVNNSIAVSPSPGTTASPIKVDTAGQLLADSIVLRASTSNTTASDMVTASFQTAAGAVSVVLQPETCTVSSSGESNCTWMGLVSRASGYNFPVGSRKFYFTVSKDGGGSTGTAASDVKVFQL